jgi:hypothetical protein
MTDTPTPSVQPVRAWAVVDKDGRFDATHIYNNLISADKVQRSYEKYCKEDAPHRVIRVEIREVNDE